MTTKEFLNGIRRRIAQGESKKDIYNQYTMTEWESCVTRFLPTQVSLRSRKKWRWLNNILLACLALITVFKVLDVFFLTSDLGSNTGRCVVLLSRLNYCLQSVRCILFDIGLGEQYWPMRRSLDRGGC